MRSVATAPNVRTRLPRIGVAEPVDNGEAEQPRISIVPHRSYRRLPIRGFRSRLASAIVVLVVEIAIVLAAARITGFVSRLVALALTSSGIAAAPTGDRFLGFDASVVTFRMATTTYETLMIWLICAAVGVAIFSLVRPALPLRYFLISNLAMVVASAAYLLVVGRPGYDAWDFTRLYLTTSLVVWLVMPVVVGLVCMLFPFSTLETAIIIVLTVAYDIVLSAARYAVFLWILATLGPVVMANLYLFFGPLLDFALVVGIFSTALVGLTRRLRTHSERWAWL